MKSKGIGLASLGAALAASSMAHAAVGLTQSVYYNNNFQGAPVYSFVNSNDGFQYSDDSSISSFFGADAAGSALTDATYVNNISFVASGYIDVLTPGSYAFTFYADDLASLSLDGNQIAQGAWYSGWQTATETLNAGYHAFKLSYVADGTPNGLSYSLTGPNGASGFEYVTQVVAGGVPEPATWAMLILGVAMIGAAVRRRGVGAALAA